MKKITFLSLAVIMILASCSVKKRVYMAGYHVEWNKSKHQPAHTTPDKKVKLALATQQKSEAPMPLVRDENRMEPSLVSTVTDPQVMAYEGKSKPLAAKLEKAAITKDYSLAAKLVQKKVMKTALKAAVKQKSLNGSKGGDDVDLILLYLLCIFIPFVAVGIVTDWEMRSVVINLLLCCLCGIPGIIHAFIVVSRYRGSGNGGGNGNYSS